MMNIFRLSGDIIHVMSIILLLLKIYATKSCAGISLKTQELYGIVFITRYLNLFLVYISLYNSVMKILFLSTSATIIYLIRRHKVVSQTYDREQDTFRVIFLIAPAALLALMVNNSFSVVEICWSFSEFLEAVAILPQLVLLQRTKNIDNLTANYVFALGAYRAMYLINWIYRYNTEPRYRDWISWGSGGVQTAIYCDFFYYYYLSWSRNQKLTLPA